MLTNMVGCYSLVPRLLDGQWEWPGNETTKLLLCYIYFIFGPLGAYRLKNMESV